MSWIVTGTVAVVGTQVYKGVKGAKQKRDAEKLAASNTLEKYEVPDQVNKVTKLAETAYLNGDPTLKSSLSLVDQSSSNAYAQAREASTSSNDLLDSINKVHKAQLDAYNQVMVNNMTYSSNAINAYQNALLNEASYEDKKYQLNEYDPYIRKANTAAAMYGAGETNIASAFDGLSNVALGLASKSLPKQVNKTNTDAYSYYY